VSARRYRGWRYATDLKKEQSSPEDNLAAGGEFREVEEGLLPRSIRLVRANMNMIDFSFVSLGRLVRDEAAEMLTLRV
jgi:hypothetical protein